MRPRHLSTVLLLGIATGCARFEAVTEIDKDGGWTRNLRYTVARQPMATEAPRVKKYFMPPGRGWKVKTNKTKQGLEMTASRTFKAGQRWSQELARIGKARLVSECSVVKVDSKTFKYREVLRWVGPAPADLIGIPVSVASKLKRILPKALRTGKALRKLFGGIQQTVSRIVYGPADPMLPKLFVQTSHGMRLLELRATQQIEAYLKQDYDEQLDEALRKNIIALLSEQMQRSARERIKQNRPSSLGSAGRRDQPIPLAFVVKLPGKVLATNGLRTRDDRQVFWSMYPHSAALGQVVLEVSWQVTAGDISGRKR